MLPTVAMTPLQPNVQFLEGNRPTVVSISVTPQETRPIERQSASDRAAARDDRTAEGEDERKPGEREPAAAAREDPAKARFGRNLNMIFDEKSGRPIIEILNPRTGEVMDRIPPESLLDKARKAELPARANLVDETA